MSDIIVYLAAVCAEIIILIVVPGSVTWQYIPGGMPGMQHLSTAEAYLKPVCMWAGGYLSRLCWTLLHLCW